ncbi:MAG: protein-tyrosine-phosphatase [Bacteroidetes bacterium]|nr:protein-tyrosine-phosphatase [Bacteroidota bacterium]
MTAEFNYKLNVLVICGRNKRRSRTAAYIFKNDSRFNIKSAGLSAKSEIVLNEKLLNWAGLILVMENGHRNRIQKQFKSINLPAIENLSIADIYEYLNPQLIDMLETRINEKLNYYFEKPSK